MDYSVMEFILSLWFHRVTLDGVSDMLGNWFFLVYSRATIMAALMQMSKALVPFADDVLKELKKAKVVYIDKTTLRVGKLLRYVWSITNNEHTYYFVHTRATDMIWELLYEFDEVVVCDGYHTRRVFKKIQRCWAHVLRQCKWAADREARETPETYTARKFVGKMKEIFNFAVDEKLEGRGPKSHDTACRMLRSTISYYEQFPEISEVVTHARNAGNQLFTFMKYEYVEATNNPAERSMREIVKHRLMRVLFRTMEGAQAFATLMTVLATCKKKKIPLQQVLRKYM